MSGTSYICVHKYGSISIKGLSCKSGNGMSIDVAINDISFAINKMRIGILCFQKWSILPVALFCTASVKMGDLNCKLLLHKVKYFIPHLSCFSLSYTNLRLFYFVCVRSSAKVRRKLELYSPLLGRRFVLFNSQRDAFKPA